MSDEETWGIRFIAACALAPFCCRKKKVADVHTLAQIMNWGQKCKKASHRASKARVWLQVKMHSFMSHPSLRLSPCHNNRMALSSGNKEIGQRHMSAGGRSKMQIPRAWTMEHGVVLSVECQLEAAWDRKGLPGDSVEASRGHIATLQGRSHGAERQILPWTQLQAADKENGQLLSELHGAVAKNLSQALAIVFMIVSPKSTRLPFFSVA